MNTVNIYIHGTTDAWNESDHPRQAAAFAEAYALHPTSLKYGNRGPDPTKFPGYIKR